jgi:hypothetical protein
MPVTLADQGIFIEPEDADELIDLLTDAAWVIGHLAAHPAAEDACAHAPARPGSCAACSVGKWPRAFTARRSRALMDSIALVVQITVLISRSNLGRGFRHAQSS